MQVTVRDLDGDDAGTLDLPRVFETNVRPDLVNRAVLAAQANRTQEYGADEYAGLRTTAESQGSGRGMAHVPKQTGRVRRAPDSFGGRKAHPPKAEKDRSLDVNDKERQLAVRSALLATADHDSELARGHNFDDDVEFPLVVSDDFEDLVKTQDVVSLLEALGVHADIERADEAATVRAGQGELRGRKYQEPTSILFVTASESGPSTARNLAGVDVASGREVNAEDLAPGEPGRLTVWTESAVEEVAQR
nr:ribosomal protein L4 [Halobacterium salinarum]